MELDLPYSFHTFSRTHKHTLLKAIPSIRNLLAPNFRLSPQKKRSLPGPSQLESDLTPTELPPLQVTPVKHVRQRASSTGNDAKQAAFRRHFDSRGPESQQERTPNPLRTRVELAPLTGSIKSSSKGYSSVARKNSLDVDQGRSSAHPQPPDSISQLRNRGEPLRAPLSQVFGVRRRTTAAKKETKTIDYVSNYASEKEEASSSAAPKAWQDLTPKDLVFSPNVPQHIMVTHFLSVVQGIRYAIGQVKPLPISQLAPLQVSLRRKKEGLNRTLILDLDETLVYAKKTEDDEVKEKFPSLDNNENSVFTVKIRPHAEEFLREMSKEFEIVVFTAGEKSYAESVLKFLDPEQKYISHLLHRGHCLRTKRGLFIKDLRVILGREMKDMVLVDNCAHSFSFQIDNGIPIITWNGDVKDQELKYLMPYLLEAKKYDDMRQYNREKLRLEELSEIPAQNIPNI